MKQTMKIWKVLLPVAVALAAAGCSREAAAPGADALKGVSPDVRAVLAGTRTTLDENGDVLWSTGDEISVFLQTKDNRKYVLDGDGGQTSGTFKFAEGATDGEAVTHNYGVYPYSDANKLTEEGTLQVTVPTVQPYAENGFADGTNVAVAVSEDKNLTFKNVCGYVKIPLYGEGVKVKRIVVTGAITQAITGIANVTVSLDADPVVVSVEDEGEKEAIVEADEAVALGATEKDPTMFWVALLPGELANGISVDITAEDADGDEFTMNKTSSESLTIVRSKVSEFPALEVRPEEKGPGYDFLHLLYYTFNPDLEVPEFISQFDFDENDGSVKWWHQVYPRYLTGISDISNRYALKRYDVSYTNLAELAFNVVDENDGILDFTEMDAAGLSVEFSTIGDTDYSSLWKEPTVFYYKSKEPFIRMSGKLFIDSDGVKTLLPTRFSRPKASVDHPEVVLDYSSFALVAWKPFKEMTLARDTYTIQVDENKTYAVALADVTGLTLKDNRPHGVSYDVFKDNGWIIGNCDPDATASSGGNGYISGVSSRQAYGITPEATVTISNDLKKMVKVMYSADGVSFSDAQDSDGSLMPYFVFDYSSEIQISGEISIPVTITFVSPWQDVSAECTIVVRGIE